MSEIGPAAKIVGESQEPLNAKTMIEPMAAKGYWPPGGKTPQAPLNPAIIRHAQVKGKEARFKKTDGGHFALHK